jgi:DUF4097 and DUF4098 domain-containing protein YvlB
MMLRKPSFDCPGLRLLLLCLAPAIFAQESGISREGSYWVKTITSSGAIRQSRLQVRTTGDISVSGTAQGSYSYTMKLRVKAANERQARERLGDLHVSAAARGDVFVLSTPPADVSSEFRLQVPHSVKDISVITAGGGVELTDLSGVLKAETGGGGVRCDRIGGSLNVATAGGGISLGTIDGTVHCVTAGGGISASLIRGPAVFETGGGDIVVQEGLGLVQASTAGGGIKVMRAGSAVAASTAGGPIQIDRAAGRVNVKTSAGPIQVNSANNLQCESAGGPISLRNISGSLRASTLAGSISAALAASLPFTDSFVTTGSGDITVFIPSNLGITVRAENDAAHSLRRIVSDFPGIAVRLQGNTVVAEGPVNGGGATLRIKGTGGTIYIRKQ